MAALSEHSNVNDIAMNIIIKKKFQVWYDEESMHFYAEKDGWDFCSGSMCGLLGLIAIFESLEPTEYRENWWRNDQLSDYRNAPRRPKQYHPVWRA